MFSVFPEDDPAIKLEPIITPALEPLPVCNVTF